MIFFVFPTKQRTTTKKEKRGLGLFRCSVVLCWGVGFGSSVRKRFFVHMLSFIIFLRTVYFIIPRSTHVSLFFVVGSPVSPWARAAFRHKKPVSSVLHSSVFEYIYIYINTYPLAVFLLPLRAPFRSAPVHRRGVTMVVLFLP